MAHTDRDDARHFWKRHYAKDGPCTLYTQKANGYWHRGTCWCDKVNDGWTRPYKYEQGVPSWWNKGIRRQERAFTRNLMQRARAGHIDWERVDDTKGDEYYW